MQRVYEGVYGLSRLAFGGGLFAAPEKLGAVLFGEEARHPAVRVALRAYGTRDTVLGLGTLRAVSGDGDVSVWLVAGVASDVLDVGLQVVEWASLPPAKRVPGVLGALGAAAAGVALLARR